MTELSVRYRRLLRRPSDIQAHLPRFVELARRLDAQHVIELGTRSGTSTVAWLYGLSFTGGTLTSVDIEPGPPLDFPRWRFIQGDDLEVADSLDPADIVFVDTCHTYEHTLAELRAYWPKVRPGGVLCCHDTLVDRPDDAPSDERPFPVRCAVRQFVHDEGLDWIEYPDSWGLGVIAEHLGSLVKGYAHA